MSSSPWPRRSSGTSAMPSRPMSAARGLRDRRPACPRARCVPLALAAPNSAWNSSRWPCPCRPPTPSTSPSRRSKLDAVQPLPAREVRGRCSAIRSVAVGYRARDRAGRDCGRSSAATISSSRDRIGVMRGDGRPLRKMVSRSATARTSAMRCEMKMTSLPSAASAACKLQQPLGLARRQRRGRLVEDEDARFAWRAPWRSRRSAARPASAAAPPGRGAARGKP